MDNQNDKKTGLGSSLLVRRTGTSEDPERFDVPNVSDASEPETSNSSEPQNAQTPETSERSNVQTSRKSIRQVVRDRCTLYLDQDVNERLRLVAGIEGKERSEIASDLLRQYLPEYDVIPKR